MIRSVLRISVHKIVAFFGGRVALVLVCLLLCCCFAAASLIAGSKQTEDVHVAIVDLCNGPLSRALCKSIAETKGIRATVVKTMEEGEDLVLFDSAEVILILDPEYDQKLLADQTETLIKLETAPGAGSAQLLRETLAGLLIAQRSEQRVREQLISEGFMSADDTLYKQYIEEAPTPHMYSVETYGKESQNDTERFGLLHASYYGIGALALLLVLLTLTRRMADAHSRNVAERIETQRFGKLISLTSDFLSLFIVGIAISLLLFLLSPDKTVAGALSLVCYSVCISGICLLISRFNTSGRIDILAPFLAIVTSIVGGCFTDLSVLSDTLKIVARCVPQGQMLAAANGTGIFSLLLLAEGIAAIAIASLLHKKSAHSS